MLPGVGCWFLSLELSFGGGYQLDFLELLVILSWCFLSKLVLYLKKGQKIDFFGLENQFCGFDSWSGFLVWGSCLVCLGILLWISWFLVQFFAVSIM